MPGWSCSRSICGVSTSIGLVRRAFAAGPTWGDFGAVAMVRVVIGLVVVGGRSLRHVAYVADDPVFQRFGGVRVVPHRNGRRPRKTDPEQTVPKIHDPTFK